MGDTALGDAFSPPSGERDFGQIVSVIRKSLETELTKFLNGYRKPYPRVVTRKEVEEVRELTKLMTKSEAEDAKHCPRWVIPTKPLSQVENSTVDTKAGVQSALSTLEKNAKIENKGSSCFPHISQKQGPIMESTTFDSTRRNTNRSRNNAEGRERKCLKLTPHPDDDELQGWQQVDHNTPRATQIASKGWLGWVWAR